MSQVNYEQLGRYAAKHTMSLEAIEVLESISILLTDMGDDKGVAVVNRCIEIQQVLRQLQGRPMAPKYGGMDRRGI